LGGVEALEISCDNLIYEELCLEILNNNELTDEEKEMLISALIYQSYYPDHDFIYEWNKNLDLDYDGEDDGYIEDAWLKIIGISPSVLIDDELYAVDGKILLDYDYKIDILDNLQGNDCRTEYIKEEENIEFNVFKNNNYLGNDKEIEFDIDEDTSFNAEFEVYLRTRIDHYEEEEYCCVEENNNCLEYCTECVYSHSNTEEDEIILEDSLDVKFYDDEPEFYFNVLGNNYGSLNFEAGIENGYLNMEFEDSYYNSFNYFYGLDMDDNILTMKAYLFDVVDFSNIIVTEGLFSVSNSNGCYIVYGDHFNSYEVDCLLNFEEYNLSVETDKLSYDLNETILVSVYPSDEDVLLSYGNESFIVNGEYEFTALPYYNRIDVKLGNEEIYKVIHVKDEDNLILLFDFGVFFGLSYIFYLVVRKYYGGFL